MNSCPRCGGSTAYPDLCLKCAVDDMKKYGDKKLNAIDLIVSPYLGGNFSNFYLPDVPVTMGKTLSEFANYGQSAPLTAKGLQEAIAQLQNTPIDDFPDGPFAPPKGKVWSHGGEIPYEPQGQILGSVTIKVPMTPMPTKPEAFPLTTFDKTFLPSIGVSGW